MRALLLLLLLCQTANAEVLKKVDPVTGHVTYTNLAPGESPAAELPPRPMRQATKQYVLPPNREAKTPDEFPSIAPAVQKDRDFGRMRILMDELRSELTAYEKAQDRKADEEALNRHRSNIASLKREIKNLNRQL